MALSDAKAIDAVPDYNVCLVAIFAFVDLDHFAQSCQFRSNLLIWIISPKIVNPSDLADVYCCALSDCVVL